MCREEICPDDQALFELDDFLLDKDNRNVSLARVKLLLWLWTAYLLAMRLIIHMIFTRQKAAMIRQ